MKTFRDCPRPGGPANHSYAQCIHHSEVQVLCVGSHLRSQHLWPGWTPHALLGSRWSARCVTCLGVLQLCRLQQVCWEPTSTAPEVFISWCHLTSLYWYLSVYSTWPQKFGELPVSSPGEKGRVKALQLCLQLAHALSDQDDNWIKCQKALAYLLRYGECRRHQEATEWCNNFSRLWKSSSYKAALTFEDDMSGSSGPIRKYGVSGANFFSSSVYPGRPMAMKRCSASTAQVHFSYFNTSSAPFKWYCTKLIDVQDCCKSQSTQCSFKKLTLSHGISSVASWTSIARSDQSIISSSSFFASFFQTWWSLFNDKAPKISAYCCVLSVLSFKRSRATSNAIQWALVTGQQEPVIVMTATWLPGLRLSRVVLNFWCKGLLSQSTPSHSIYWNSLPVIPLITSEGWLAEDERLWQTYVEKIQVCSPNQNVDFPSITLFGLNVMGYSSITSFMSTMVSIPLVHKCACDCSAI